MDDLEARVQARTAELSQRLSVERILAQIAARLISADEPVAAIRRTLSDIGAMMQAERVALVRPRKTALARPARIPGVARVRGAAVNRGGRARGCRIPSWSKSQLAKREIFAVAAARQLPPKARGVQGGCWTWMMRRPWSSYRCATATSRQACSSVRTSEPSPDDLPHDIESLEVVAGLLTGLLAREAYLRTLEQQVADRTRELSVFLDIGLLVSEERRLTESLESGLPRILEAIGCDAGCVHTLDAGGSELTLLAAQGLAPQHADPPRHASRSPGRWRDWLAKLNPPLLFRADLPSRDLPPAMRLPAYPHVLAAQLRASGEVIGVLSCFARPKAELTINRISLAAAFGEQVGVIVQNHRLQQQAQELAVVAERQRLARELHDAVTQSLYSQTLFTRSAINAARRGTPGADQRTLAPGGGQRLAGATRDARDCCTNCGRLTWRTKPWRMPSRSA